MSIARLPATILLVLSVCGCTADGSHRTDPLKEVKVLEITQDGRPVAYPQRWLRNTLLVDLQGVSGSGSIVLRPQTGNGWPVRVALEVTPGSVGVLEVTEDDPQLMRQASAQSAERVRSILPITQSGSKPVHLTLDPALYSPGTEHIEILWRPEIAATR